MADGHDAVAVIGMAARVPGAADVEQLWANLVGGRESVVRLSDAELDASGVPAAERGRPDYVPVWAPVDDVTDFDASFFGMTPREAAGTDPQIRLFLEVAHAAIEDAGYAPSTLAPSVGVFGTAGANRYQQLHLGTRPGAGVETAFTDVNQSDYLATTASYRLDLRGPSLTVRTACSGGLVAVHLACQALRAGDCDAAVVGGADVELPLAHGYRSSGGSIQSPDGRCRPFDADANGTVFGSGGVAFVLKLLEDAERDGDRVAAVLLGSAVNNDGADKLSFGAPSVDGQVRVVVEALAMAGVSPRDIGYVEAHGTGTPLGDPVEVAALTRAFALSGGGPEPGRCGIGSVKGNVGHLGPVAGLVGMLKAVLALDREALPPSINFRAPNPRIGLEHTPFQVVTSLRSWPRRPDRPRHAGVSSLGIGGTNAHVVLGEGPEATTRIAEHRPRVLVWSATDEQGCDELARRLADHVARTGDAGLADAAATLQHGRATHPVRRAVVGRDARDVRRALRDPVRTVRPGTGAPTLPPATADDAAGFAPLLRDVPGLRALLEEWLRASATPEESWRAQLDGPQAWGPLLALAARGALATTWVAAGVDPGTVRAPELFTPVLDVLAGRAAPADVLRAPGATAAGTRVEPAAVLVAHVDALARAWVGGAAVDWSAAGQPPPVRRAALPAYPYARTRHWVDYARTRHWVDPAVAAPAAPVDAAPASTASHVVWRDATTGRASAVDRPTGDAAVVLAVLTDGGEPGARAAVALAQTGATVVRVTAGDAYAARPGRYVVRPEDVTDVGRVVADLRDRGLHPSLVVHGTSAAGHVAPSTGPGRWAEALQAETGPGAAPAHVLLTSAAVDVAGAEDVDRAVAARVRDALGTSPATAWLDVAGDVPLPVLGRHLRDALPVAALRGGRSWVPDRVPAAVDVPTERLAARLHRGTTLLVVDVDGDVAGALAAGVAARGLGTHVVAVVGHEPSGRASLEQAEDAGARLTVVRLASGRPDVTEAVRAGLAAVTGALHAVVLAPGAPTGTTGFVDAVADGLGPAHHVDTAVAVVHDEARGTCPTAAAVAQQGATDLRRLDADHRVHVSTADVAASVPALLSVLAEPTVAPGLLIA